MREKLFFFQRTFFFQKIFFWAKFKLFLTKILLAFVLGLAISRIWTNLFGHLGKIIANLGKRRQVFAFFQLVWENSDLPKSQREHCSGLC